MSIIKRYILLLTVLAFPTLMKADQCCETVCCQSYCWTIEARASAYFPIEGKVRRIYSSTFGLYEGEINAAIWGGFDGYFSAGYLTNTGRSIGLHNKTRLQMVPLTLGLKYFVELTPSFDLYLGGGAVYSFLNIRDHSPFVHRHVSKNAFGGTIKVGALYFFADNWFVDFSVDYLYQKFKFKTSLDSEPFVERYDLDMSGIKVGAGIGLAF